MAILSFHSKSKSFTELLEENKLKFYKTAKIILKNDDDVYDALQDALLSMYQNYNALKDKKLFSTWGTRIVINKCYDFLRKRKNNVIALEETIENDIKISSLDEYDIDKYGIKEAMNEYLSEEQKLVVILFYYDDYSLKDISKILDIPEGTVKSRLSKARDILKEKLEKEEI